MADRFSNRCVQRRIPIGSLSFVGTKGPGVFLFGTSEGHILMNTGMPSSGTTIVGSVRKLGFGPEDIEIMIDGHAHIDHAAPLPT
jgi:metallo-beta-lactamase class B